MSALSWLNHAQWTRPKPFLPTDVRGVPRVDDRRVISCIIHVQRSGCRWADAPSTYGPRKTFYNRFVRWTMRSVWRRVLEALAATGGLPVEVLLDSTHAKAHRCSAGGKRGRRAKRSAALEVVAPPSSTPWSDGLVRPLRFRLTGGQAADCRAVETLVAGLPPRSLVMADRAYDSDAIRRQIEGQDAVLNIPPRPRAGERAASAPCSTVPATASSGCSEN